MKGHHGTPRLPTPCTSGVTVSANPTDNLTPESMRIETRGHVTAILRTRARLLGASSVKCKHQQGTAVTPPTNDICSDRPCKARGGSEWGLIVPGCECAHETCTNKGSLDRSWGGMHKKLQAPRMIRHSSYSTVTGCPHRAFTATLSRPGPSASQEPRKTRPLAPRPKAWPSATSPIFCSYCVVLSLVPLCASWSNSPQQLGMARAARNRRAALRHRALPAPSSAILQFYSHVQS